MWWKHKHKRQGSVLMRNKDEEYMSFSRLKCICIANCHFIWCILSLSLRDKIQGSQCAAFTPDLHNLSIRAKPRSALSLSPKHKSNRKKTPELYIEYVHSVANSEGGQQTPASAGSKRNAGVQAGLRRQSTRGIDTSEKLSSRVRKSHE